MNSNFIDAVSDKLFLRYLGFFLITSLIITKTRNICISCNPNLVRKEQKDRIFLSLSCKHSCLLLVNSSATIQLVVIHS